jgi:uncharacterized protein YjbI with pentapeptide repeats
LKEFEFNDHTNSFKCDSYQILSRLEYKDRHFLESTFTNSIFFKDIIFENCTFESEVNFEGTFFEGGVYFLDCVFEKFALFRGSNFGERANFSGSHFKQGFSAASGLGVIGVDGTKGENSLHYHLNFSKCEFSGYVTFNNRDIRRSANFNAAIFNQPPHFQNCELHQGTTFDQCVFSLRQAKEEREMSRAVLAFRRLKTLMKDRNNIQDYSLFYALELDARIKTKIPVVEKICISLYSLGSNYGRSLSRPFIFLLLISINNILLLLFIDSLTITKGALFKTKTAFLFVFQHIFQPFSVWSPEFVDTMAQVYFSDAALFFIGTTQSVLTLLFLSLLLVTLRRKFPD